MGASESESASEAEDDAPAFGEQKKVSVLDYDKYFSKERLLNNTLVCDKTNIHSSNNALNQIPAGFEHDIDFTRFHPSSIY